MTIPSLVEPATGGFRARTGGPFDASAEAATAELAVAENPLFDDWLREVEAFRARRDADDRDTGA